MYNLRTELIKSAMQQLKIDDNPFNTETIKGFISHVPDEQLKKLYSMLFGTEHSYLNGMDRVSKVAAVFIPVVVENPLELKAKKLINLVEAISSKVFTDAKADGIPFDDKVKLLSLKKMKDIDEYDLKVLDAVKPYCDAKQLITHINEYQDSKNQLQAFVSALKYGSSGSLAVSNSMNNLNIRRK